jgi:hypothetical protein
MKAVRPTPMTAARLISSSVDVVVPPYESAALWTSGATFNIGNFCYLNNTVYQSLQNANTNRNPATEPTWWAPIGPTNRWAMFDGTLNNSTVGATPFSVTINIGQADTLAVLGVIGADITLTIRDGLGGPVVYTQSIALTGDSIGDWWEYFYFDPLLTKTIAVFKDLPRFASAHATIEITETVTEEFGTTIQVGEVVFGLAYDLGCPEFGASSSIIDYSRVDRDEFGTATLVRRAFSKRLTARLWVEKNQVNRVHRFLTDFRATPVLWLLTDDEAYDEPGVIYGPFKDFGIDIAYPTHSICALEIEGMN